MKKLIREMLENELNFLEEQNELLELNSFNLENDEQITFYYTEKLNIHKAKSEIKRRLDLIEKEIEDEET